MRKNSEKQQRVYRGHSRKLRLWLSVILSGTLVFGLIVLIRYGIDLYRAGKTETELKEIYYSSPAAENTETGWSGPDTKKPPQENTEPPTVMPENALVPEGTEHSRTVDRKLEAVPYPGNPEGRIGYRFTELRKENKDIVGWLKLDRLLEEAVVQRNNTYYMTHDAKKRENINGAIFLDAAISLKTRPYTLLIYGHNMKSGAMFGCLRNYENTSYYRKSPFLSFESLYEEGRYVVFAAGSIGLEENQADYIDVFGMLSDRRNERQQVIDVLKEVSVFPCAVDVQPEDQLLLMVTCVDQDERRRVVAARRLREGESETALLEMIRSRVKELNNP